MTGLKAIWLAIGFVIGLGVVSPVTPAHALMPQSPEAPAEEQDTIAESIDAAPGAGSDEQIAARISSIFNELPKLEPIDVRVSEGVVVLSGTVANEEDMERAERIASRVSGVVTVENELERNLSVSDNLGEIGGLSQKVSDFTKMLPLIGAAALVALLIGLIGYAIAGLTGLWRRITPNAFLAELVASAIRFVFVVGGIVIALDMIGAGALLGAVLGGAGVIGIALGFAMRDTVENYVASLMLSLRQPFRANDHVLIDDLEGRVIRLTTRATVLMTLDGNHLRIPNGQVFKAVILNYTRNPQRRFDFELGVDADDDANAARRLGRETLKALDFILDEPGPEGRIVNVGDSNVVIRFLAWIDQREADWHKARTRAIAATKTALEEAGFALPEPIYRLRFDPRTQPLPFENIGDRPDGGADTAATSTTRSPTPAPRSRKPSVQEEDEDIRPQNEIADMVDKERVAGGEQEKDLLDADRPVE